MFQYFHLCHLISFHLLPVFSYISSFPSLHLLSCTSLFLLLSLTFFCFHFPFTSIPLLCFLLFHYFIFFHVLFFFFLLPFFYSFITFTSVPLLQSLHFLLFASFLFRDLLSFFLPLLFISWYNLLYLSSSSSSLQSHVHGDARRSEDEQ